MTRWLEPLQINELINELNQGHVVAFATETVFGFAALAKHPLGYQNLINAKHRPLEKAFPLLVESMDVISHYAEVNEFANKVIQHFLPGPLTVVLPLTEAGRKDLKTDLKTIAIRFPNDPFILSLMNELKQPLWLTSANRSGEAPCQTDQDVYTKFVSVIGAVVRGQAQSQTPTTIVDFTSNSPKLIRQGEIQFEDVLRLERKQPMKIALGSDHAGFPMKETIKKYLIDHHVEVLDVGTVSEASTDYPTYGIAAAELVANRQADQAIVICGTGIGISIAANKVKGIRAALVTAPEMAVLARQHNDANVLALSGRFIDDETNKKIVEAWLKTNYEQGRHQKRIDLISTYEKGDSSHE